jgi:flagellar assembly factor FliW
MSTVTFESSRFGTLEIETEEVIEFESGLIGLGGARYALLTTDDQSPFAWLQSIDDAELALPITNPWLFFTDYAVDVDDAEAKRIGIEDPSKVDVWVTVRAASELQGFSANLRAPILVWNGRGHQVINEAQDAPVRAPLFAAAAEPVQAA